MEWVAKVAVFLLRDLYDTCRLWYIKPRARTHSEIDLYFVLGYSVNNRELSERVFVIDGVDWYEVPVEQTRRGTCRNDASSGHSVEAGDFVW